MKLEIYASSTTDLIRESLQNNLSTEQLAEFARSLGDDLTNEHQFYAHLKKKLDRMKLDEI